MPVKVYKRTDASRSMLYQDSLLATAVPGWPNVPVFFDEDRLTMFRPTRRQEKDEIYTASLALLGDTEAELVAVAGAAKLRGSVIRCVEEGLTLGGKIKAREIKRLWKDARRAGAAMRGARISADTKKARTAAALKQIEHELEATDIPTRQLLDRVGIKAVNSIKNHYGICREQMQIRYQAEQKRKERRKLQLPVKK